MKTTLIKTICLVTTILVSLSIASCSPTSPSGKLVDENVTTAVTQGVQYNIYIGTGENFTAYPVTYTGHLDEQGNIPASQILNAISSLTGWNLTLSDEITSGKGGMTISFANDSSIFSENTANIKSEFLGKNNDKRELVGLILDSIKHTLQNYYVDTTSGGNPNNLDIYFTAQDNKPIIIDSLNINVPMDAPYSGLN